MSAAGGRILIVDDEEEIRALLCRLLRQEGFEALTASDGEAALGLLRRESPDVLLLDIRMPGVDGMEVLRRVKEMDRDLPVIMITAYGLVKGAVQALRAGAYDYLEKPFEHAEVIGSVHRAFNDRQLRRTVRILSERAGEAPSSLRDLMGPGDQIARISAEVSRVASSNFTVLIRGETGTGKELVAEAIHRASPRARGPFVAVDCGAIPETLFESELFGYEKGAFTGAEGQRPGKFEIASGGGGGTLFLDEIANMPPGCQAKLLRALQDKRVTRVGGTKPLNVNIRLIAATNRDLTTLAFRRDLFFRLNEFTITIPPLRNRKGDVIFLAKRFLDLTNHELDKDVRGFSDPAVERLLSYDWPGNVRELRSAIRRAVLLADRLIDVDHLGLPHGPPVPPGLAGVSGEPTEGLPLRELVRRTTVAVERAALISVLQRTGGNKAKAARLLQIDYKTIHLKVKEYGIATREEERGTWRRNEAKTGSARAASKGA